MLPLSSPGASNSESKWVNLATYLQPIGCSANVSFLFPHLPLVAALDAAAASGFRTVELLDPYVLPPSQLEFALKQAGLRVERRTAPLASAIEAGRLAYEGGLMETRDMAAPSTPVAGTPFFDLERP